MKKLVVIMVGGRRNIGFNFQWPVNFFWSCPLSSEKNASRWPKRGGKSDLRGLGLGSVGSAVAGSNSVVPSKAAVTYRATLNSFLKPSRA
jgi:hypothetical protein